MYQKNFNDKLTFPVSFLQFAYIVNENKTLDFRFGFSFTQFIYNENILW